MNVVVYFIPNNSIPYTLEQKKCIIWKKYQVCIDCNGIWAVLSWAQNDMYSNNLGLRETREEYRNGLFCKLLSEPFDKMYMTRGQGQWPRVTGKNGSRKVAFLLKKSVGYHRVWQCYWGQSDKTSKSYRLRDKIFPATGSPMDYPWWEIVATVTVTKGADSNTNKCMCTQWNTF